MIEIKKADIIIFILTFFVFIISFVIIKSFIIPFIFTIILVYILNPVYKKLIKIFRNHILTSLFIILVFLLLFISPVIYSVFVLSNDFSNIGNAQINEKINVLSDKINNKFGTSIDLKTQIKNSLNKINEIFDSIILRIPEFIFNLFIIIFFYYYFSKDYNHEINYLKNILYGRKVIYLQNKLKKLIDGLIYGQILVRFIQAVIGTIGFLILGIDNGLLWGTMLFFVAFLPVIGTGLIWGPLVILELIHANYLISFSILIIGIIISSIDNLLLPYFISEKTNIGPVLTLISIIGGLEFFGFYGIILGPFFLGLLLVLIDEILYEIRENNPNYKKYIWMESERKKYRKLKTDEAKKKFIIKLNKKYDLQEKKILEI